MTIAARLVRRIAVEFRSMSFSVSAPTAVRVDVERVLHRQRLERRVDSQELLPGRVAQADLGRAARSGAPCGASRSRAGRCGASRCGASPPRGCPSGASRSGAWRSGASPRPVRPRRRRAPRSGRSPESGITSWPAAEESGADAQLDRADGWAGAGAAEHPGEGGQGGVVAAPRIRMPADPGRGRWGRRRRCSNRW